MFIFRSLDSHGIAIHCDPIKIPYADIQDYKIGKNSMILLNSKKSLDVLQLLNHTDIESAIFDVQFTTEGRARIKELFSISGGTSALKTIELQRFVI